MSVLLPPREYAVALALRAGLSVRGAARQLGITYAAAKSARTSLYARLGVERRAQLLALQEIATFRTECARCSGPIHRRDVGTGRQRTRFCSDACGPRATTGQRSCRTCGRELRRGRGRPPSYCSSACARRSPLGDRRACLHCRGTFYVPRDEPTAYCSRSCAWRARDWMRDARPRRCAWLECAAAFRPTQPRERFHSLACRRAWDAQRRRERATTPATVHRARPSLPGSSGASPATSASVARVAAGGSSGARSSRS